MSAVSSPVRSAITAPVLEVFESRQGEGILVGDPQVFVRFGGCNLTCNYCDTPESIPLHAGVTQTIEQVEARIARLGGTPGVVSLTGGEPLLQIGFLEKLIPRLKAAGWRIYLETNGTLPQALAKIVDQCDWIAMDFKPSTAIGRDVWEAHRWFLEMGGNKIFVKLVLTDQTTDQELTRAVSLLREVGSDIPLILQPATPQGTVGSVTLARLISWWQRATAQLSDVRILPQIHRLWGIP